MIDFSFMPEIIRMLIFMFHEDILEISYHKYIKT